MAKSINLIICGAGNDDPYVLNKIENANLVLTRGSFSAAWLKFHQINSAKIFNLDKNQTIEAWVQDWLTDLPDNSLVVYVTCISPVFMDQVVLTLIKVFGREQVQIREGMAIVGDLAFEISTGHPFTVIDNLMLIGKHHPPFSSDNDVLIFDPGSHLGFPALKTLLGKVYSLDHGIYLMDKAEKTRLCWRATTLECLDTIRQDIVAMFIPAASHARSIENFQEVIAHLRAPEDGCPWDIKQTHASLRTYLLEETYEALDALDHNDAIGLKEELGDILLQILLHAQIASESGEFTMAEVIENIHQKIVYRHPHVFKDWKVSDETDVLQNWESLKEQERKQNGNETRKGMLDGVPDSFPALAQAQSIQDRAARVGFDWPEIAPVLDKVMEELEEVKTAANDAERAKELGDLLFAIVNLIRWHQVDAESALRKTNQKFRKRFAFIEEQARLAGKELQKMTLAEMDTFWEQAKAFDD